MKNIELTEEHKTKLLEMCNELFPEDEFTFDNDYAEDGIIDRNFLGKTKNDLTWEDKGSHFHWFEFCMTHLANKILIQDEQLSDFLLTINIELHPINYLYKEFKNIKKL